MGATAFYQLTGVTAAQVYITPIITSLSATAQTPCEASGATSANNLSTSIETGPHAAIQRPAYLRKRPTRTYAIPGREHRLGGVELPLSADVHGTPHTWSADDTSASRSGRHLRDVELRPARRDRP